VKKTTKRNVAMLSTIFVSVILFLIVLPLIKGKPLSLHATMIIGGMTLGMITGGFLLGLLLVKLTSKKPHTLQPIISAFFFFLAVFNGTRLIMNYMSGKSFDWFLLINVAIFLLLGGSIVVKLLKGRKK